MPQVAVILSDPFNDPAQGEHMEFRLTYTGPLRATQRDPLPGTNDVAKHWELKHEMRLVFHPQLKRFWETTKFIADNQTQNSPKSYHAKSLAAEFCIPPWHFVPLITGRLELITGIDVLLMRLDHPGSSIWSGDIDNRIKTLIDALVVPGAQAGYANLTPDDTCNPLYCLMEDDKYLNNISITTDRLMSAPPGADQSYAHVVITVKLRPDNLTFGNMGF